MKNRLLILLLFTTLNTLSAQTKNIKTTDDYIEFDDRKNIVHGLYLGFGVHYGRIDGEGTIFSTLKLAYVANQKLEIGVAFTGFYNDRPNTRTDLFDGEEIALVGGYAGIHIEPILFGDRFISVSFPLLVGAGSVIFMGNDTFENDEDIDKDDYDTFFIVEPGVNILYNFTRYTQLETGFRYRFAGDFDLSPYKKGNINGYSVVIGLKVGIFNMGRKKKIKDSFQ